MEQKLYFKNGDDLKRKVCELLDNCVDFKVTGTCITIERENNVRIKYSTKEGIKEKEIFVEGFFMQDIVKNLYGMYHIDEITGEPCIIMAIEIIK